MPYQNLITSMGMSEKQRFEYRDRAKKGDFYEVEGAFGDRVWVQKSVGGPNPAITREKNRLRLDWVERYIQKVKETQGKSYRKSLFGLIPSA